MHYVELSVPILFLEKMPHKRPAHLLDFVNEIPVQVERTIMVPNIVNRKHPAPPVPWSRENVYVMSFPLQRRRQLRHMRRHSPHRRRVQRLPRKHRYPHLLFIASSVYC
jgi:hypothetical protein